jgi:hypothetical protein
MKRSPPRWIAVAVAALAAVGARAADAVPPPPRGEVQLEASAVDEKLANEPFVKRTVIDDKHNHIEELRVRGQLQKVTVAPKDGAPSYEIITGDGSRDLSPGVNTSRGAAGQRVWNILHF